MGVKIDMGDKQESDIKNRISKGRAMLNGLPWNK